ncbi:unnamed protein product [Pleuronectes platessa]|uniref:Uncharacterized protein n=1 Tax=Pleuronectes platessa TaxID=8262 RepID=A0A9N7YJP1_PLEPL|nr:unnamed protein product [Pleuronectes platessa]
MEGKVSSSRGQMEAFCCSIPLQSLQYIEGVRRRRAICNYRSNREILEMWLKRGETRGGARQPTSHQDTSWDVSLSCFAWRRVCDVERPGRPEDSRNITEDVWRSFCKGINTAADVNGPWSVVLRDEVPVFRSRATPPVVCQAHVYLVRPSLSVSESSIHHFTSLENEKSKERFTPTLIP